MAEDTKIDEHELKKLGLDLSDDALRDPKKLISTLGGFAWTLGLRDMFSSGLGSAGTAGKITTYLGKMGVNDAVWGKRVAATLGYSVYIAQPLGKLGVTAKQTFFELRGMGKMSHPLHTGHGVVPDYLKPGNKVYAFHRKRTFNQAKMGVWAAFGMLPGLASDAVLPAGVNRPVIYGEKGRIKTTNPLFTKLFQGTSLAISKSADMKAADMAKIPSAYEWIVDVIDSTEQHRKSNRTGGIGVSLKGRRGSLSMREAVEAVFSQHQENIGGMPFNDRFREKEKFDATCQLIADAIEKKGGDPRILFSLVGDGKVVDDYLHIADEDVVRAEIRALTQTVEQHEKVDVKAIIRQGAFGTEQELKAIYDQLQGDDKVLFAALQHPKVRTDVLKMTLEQSKAADEQMGGMLAENAVAMVQEIAAIPKEDWQKHGLSTDEGKAIAELARKINDAEHAQHQKIMTEALDGQTLEKSALMNARSSWEERVGGKKASMITPDAIIHAGGIPPHETSHAERQRAGQAARVGDLVGSGMGVAP